jgi:hypothetical protein
VGVIKTGKAFGQFTELIDLAGLYMNGGAIELSKNFIQYNRHWCCTVLARRR